MDLLSITLKIWRYRLVTIPIILLTLAGAAYVVAIKKPEYQAKGNFALLYPPPPPTAEELARDPELAKIDTNNPFTRFSDGSVVISILSTTMNARAAQEALSNPGVTWVVAPSVEFSYSTPVVSVAANAYNPVTAVRTAATVGEELSQELDQMQARRGVDKRYRIRTLQIGTPGQARLQASGKLRTFVGVLVLGAVSLFIAVSIADALATLRDPRLRRERLGRQDAPINGSAGPYPPAPEPAVVATNGHHDVEAEELRDAAAGDRGHG